MATAHIGMRDETAFSEYKQAPSPDRLAALLNSVQDRVYNICFQILRRAEDAEDACQEVLIELTRGLPTIDAPRPFKVWLYRVAVHTALDRKESRDRQARLAPKALKPEGLPMDESERAELMRALGTLDDRTRCLVLEHYFDKATLEEIGAREGVSAVAIFKRLDRARETLRRALLGAGFTVAAAGVAKALESVSPVVAPAGMAAKSALIAGGVVMGTKSAVSAGSIVAVLLIAGSAATGGFVAGNGRSASQVRTLQAEVARLSRPTGTAAIPTSHQPETDVTTEAKSEPAIAMPRSSSTTEKGEVLKTGFVPDPTPVSYGRPTRAKIEDLQNAETWDDFYKKVQEQKSLGSEALENLIFQRVAKELDLDVTEAQSLRKLFEAEREETTRIIVDSAGGPAGFSKMKDDLGMNWKVIYDDWRRQRNIVRQAHDPDYQKILTYDQLQFFNQHLRNSEIAFEASYGPEGRFYLVTGVGRPGGPK